MWEEKSSICVYDQSVKTTAVRTDDLSTQEFTGFILRLALHDSLRVDSDPGQNLACILIIDSATDSLKDACDKRASTPRSMRIRNVRGQIKSRIYVPI